MTNAAALPLLTASHSHLQYPSPVLPPGSVLPWHPPAHFQLCSVHTTGTPAGSASCSPGLRSWHSSGDLLGPGDVQTCSTESGIAHIAQDQKQQYCSHAPTGPRSCLKSSLLPGNGAWPLLQLGASTVRKAAASTRQGETDTRLPPLPCHTLGRQFQPELKEAAGEGISSSTVNSKVLPQPRQ